MDKQIQEINQPDYKQIYIDIITVKFPEKMEKCFFLLNKKKLSDIDIIELNKRVFETEDLETEKFNQKLRSYNTSSIIKILDYQQKNSLNNTQLAKHFKLSRNTVAKWKKMNIC